MTDAVVTNTPIAPTRTPLNQRKECLMCRGKSREYSQACSVCYDACLCTACEAKGALRLPQTVCCNNYYCDECRDNITIVCPDCRRTGCVVCFDGRCAVSDRLCCEACLAHCDTCSEEMRLKEFSGKHMCDGRAECNACHKSHLVEDKKRKRREEKDAAVALLEQHGMANPFNDDNSD